MNKSNLGLSFFEEKKSDIIIKNVCLVVFLNWWMVNILQINCYVLVIISVDNQDQMDVLIQS